MAQTHPHPRPENPPNGQTSLTDSRRSPQRATSAPATACPYAESSHNERSRCTCSGGGCKGGGCHGSCSGRCRRCRPAPVLFGALVGPRCRTDVAMLTATRFRCHSSTPVTLGEALHRFAANTIAARLPKRDTFVWGEDALTMAGPLTSTPAPRHAPDI